MTQAYAVQYLEQSKLSLTQEETMVRSIAMVRSISNLYSHEAAVLGARRIKRSDTERGKLGIRSWRVGGWELSIFRAFGMRNVSIKRNGLTVVKVGVR